MAVAIVAAAPTWAQSLYWDVDFSTVFDNREGDGTYTAAETFFQTQLAPEIGITLDGGTHRIAVGVVWTQPIGAEWDGYRLSPTLYYRYSSRGLKFAMGMFGRKELHRPLPNYIWNDSVYYCQRNIRGAMIQNVGRDGFVEMLLDWRGMQSDTRREAFNIILQGEWQRRGSVFVAGGVAMMNHLARTKNAPDTQQVIDNFIYNPYVGVELGSHTPIDSLGIRAGVLGSLTRDRLDRQWRTPVGVWVDIDLAWRWLELKNTFYAGGKLFPIYSRYGALLDQGEPFYASPYYNRTSLMGTAIDTHGVNLRASLDFNVARGSFIFYQSLILTVDIGSDTRKK